MHTEDAERGPGWWGLGGRWSGYQWWQRHFREPAAWDGRRRRRRVRQLGRLQTSLDAIMIWQMGKLKL